MYRKYFIHVCLLFFFLPLFTNIMFLLFAGRETVEEELIHCHEFSWRFHYRSILVK